MSNGGGNDRTIVAPTARYALQANYILLRPHDPSPNGGAIGRTHSRYAAGRNIQVSLTAPFALPRNATELARRTFERLPKCTVQFARCAIPLATCMPFYWRIGRYPPSAPTC